MHIEQYIFATMSGLLVVSSSCWCMWLIKTKVASPTLSTWLVWTSTSLIMLASQLCAGVFNVMVIAGAICTTVALGFVVCYGSQPWRRKDTYFVLAALLGIALWTQASTDVARIEIAFLTGLSGSLPTFLNEARRPGSERFSSWGISLLATICQMLAIPDVRLESWLQPCGSILVQSAMLLLIMRGQFAGKFTRLAFAT